MYIYSFQKLRLSALRLKKKVTSTLHSDRRKHQNNINRKLF